MSLVAAIERLEAEVYASQVETALGQLFDLLKILEGNAADETLTHLSGAEAQTLCTRMAAAVIALFSNPGFELSHPEYVRLSYWTPTLAHVFRLSGFRTADDLLDSIVRRGGTADPRAFRNKSDARKFLLACSLFSRHFPRMCDLVRNDSQVLHAVFLRAFTVHVTAEHRIQDHREQLLAAVSHLTGVTPRTPTLPTLHQVWALCSYMTTPDRHQAKAHLNRMLGNWLRQEGFAEVELPPRPGGRKKPTLLVACEVLAGAHVMHRCFGRFLRQLRQRFHVVALVAGEDLGPGGAEWCDELKTFSRGNPGLSAAVEIVRSVAPDAIYFPCIGMQLWTILLCNLRLAPLQFATLGHPATTHSPHVDAVILGKDMLGNAACFSEQVVLLRSPGHLYELRADDVRPEVNVRRNASPVRVAVVANLLKLNATFLATCQELVRRSRRPLEFHVFPNCIGLRWQLVRQQLTEGLTGSAVHVYSRMPLADYRRALGACDLYLSPFPFGGENSMLDALLQRLPAVTLLGQEPHSRLDARVMRLAGLPEWLCTHTRDDYIEAALKLIENVELREEIARILSPEAIQDRVERENARFHRDFVDAAWWLFLNQEAIRTSPHQVWRPLVMETLDS